MEHVSDILHAKGNSVWSVEPSQTVGEALKMLTEKNIGALLVADPDGEIMGVFSERDFARYCAQHGGIPLDKPVKDIMAKEVVYIRPDQSIKNCMALMTEKRIRHLPVIDEKGHLGGLISIGDVVKSAIYEKDILIDQLEHYIVSSI
ncbi:MAG: CBS domain-containing protein [Spirochaetia bacterium]|nr:CBS domain-containing protein [Spirochaetia bacterium]MCF7946932.1 CBS domain-containing protein [Spirochaetia bacterium]MCF7953396.1 CBS domain-containing protein [Spirochaetales bacterium]